MDNHFAIVDQYATLQTLDQQGFTCIPNFFSTSLCEDFIHHYNDHQRYRSTINMTSHNFGDGQYRYFKYPLPELISRLREQSYNFLLPLARKWALALNQDFHYPDSYQQYLQKCHQAGQCRPTPLILRYQEEGYNRLHQDLYGDLVFPLQMVILLSQPQRDFEGGELVLTEQRPRVQIRAHVLTPGQGDAVILVVHQFPRQGTRGYHRVSLRHGVSTLKRGTRYTLGVILHDAQ